MRVLWVSTTIPHPEEAGGWAHEFELISALVDRHDVHVLSSDPNDPISDALADIGVPLTRVDWPLRPFPGNRVALASAVLRARPNLAMWRRQERLPRLANTMRRMSNDLRPDLVHITLGELAPLIDASAAPTALLLFDAMTRVIEAQLEHAPTTLRRAQHRVEVRRTERFEKKWYPRADAVAAVSSVDAEWISRLAGVDVETIASPVPDHFFASPDRPRRHATVTFVGTLNHEPNADAIEWLTSRIWPRVHAARPDAELVVVGRGDREGIITARTRERVEAVGGRLHADVDDIRPYYWEATVVVAPMRLGAGMRNKVIHAMACGAPVVTTPLALEGVPAIAAEHALVAHDTDRIVAAVLEVLQQSDDVRRRALAAGDGVESLRTPAVAARLEAWWGKAASR